MLLSSRIAPPVFAEHYVISNSHITTFSLKAASALELANRPKSIAVTGESLSNGHS
jgi:hypothetical protein